MSAPKAKSYKELLTTSLHRQFTTASLLVLTFCWLEASLLSSDSLLWSIIPFGYTGIRTLLLFIPCLIVFIIRVDDLHYGERTTTSSFQTVLQSCTSKHALITLGWYIASAQLFGLAYIWTKGVEGKLGWIDQGRAYERARLNENPILLRVLYTILAITQTFTHLVYDLDRVQLDGRVTKTTSTSNTIIDSLESLKARAAPIARTAINVSIAGFVAVLPIYYGLLRHLIWSPMYSVARTFDSSLPRNADPPGIDYVATLLWQAVSSAFLLTALWSVSNSVFTILMSQQPLKKGEPLTSDMSNAGVPRAVDPNGTLINGLLRKKESVRTFALWELYLICTQFDARRKTIFLDVDRAGGSSWTQISQQCLKEIDAISTRITQHQSAVTTVQAAPPSQEVPGLPRIASEQARQGDILTKPRPDFAQSVGSIARSAGQHPGATGAVTPARKALAWSTDHVLSKQQQQQLNPQHVMDRLWGQIAMAIQAPYGEAFRDTFARTAKTVVLGTPYSSRSNIEHAAQSLAALLKASLVEDTCGVVAKDVPLVIRTLLNAIRTTRQFLETLQPSWTDTHFQQSDRQVPEVLALIAELQKALEAILLAFSEYAASLGMSKKELREAKEAVGMNTHREMMQVR